MASHKAGPYTLTYYTVYDNMSHDIEFNCDVLGAPPVGAPPEDVSLKTRDGEGVTLAAGANALWGMLRSAFNGTTLAVNYTLWKRNTENDERLFVSSGALTAPNGTSASANVPAWQATLTWRSGRGGIMKIVLLEGVFSGNNRVPMSSGGTVITALSAYILSSSNFVMSRDRAWPVAAMNASFGQNEKLHKARYR